MMFFDFLEVPETGLKPLLIIGVEEDAILFHEVRVSLVADIRPPDFHGNVEFVTWNGVPYKDGMISTYNNYIRTRCRGKNYEITFD